MQLGICEASSWSSLPSPNPLPSCPSLPAPAAAVGASHRGSRLAGLVNKAEGGPGRGPGGAVWRADGAGDHLPRPPQHHWRIPRRK